MGARALLHAGGSLSPRAVPAGELELGELRGGVDRGEPPAQNAGELLRPAAGRRSGELTGSAQLRMLDA